jgi:hypothetical protein
MLLKFPVLLGCALLLSACALRVIHDGVSAVVVDTATRRPIRGAVVVNRFGVSGELAQSDESGRINLEPRTHHVTLPLSNGSLNRSR